MTNIVNFLNQLAWYYYILIFFVIQLVNVVLNTLKTIITAKGKKIPAAIINALTFGFYAIVVVLTAQYENLWITVGVTIVTNLIGVYGSIWVLDKLRKDKLWEITATVATKEQKTQMCCALFEKEIMYNVGEVHNIRALEYVFHIYCPTQKESAEVKKILTTYNAKYIVHEENVKL